MLFTGAAVAAAFLSRVSASPTSDVSLSTQSLVSRNWPWPFPKCGPFAPISCSNTTVVKDLCCFNAPGGRLLATQLWNYNAVAPEFEGPEDSWTIHGAWPDHCDGTYDSFCDPSREIFNVSSVLKAAGEGALLKYMETYWLNSTGGNELFWEHEYNKHGTCISTLEPSCFGPPSKKHPNPDVIAYFSRAVSLFKQYPTYSFLKKAGIVPSLKKTYTLAQIEGALVKSTGHNATVACDASGYLTEVWYHGQVQGSFVDGAWFKTEPDGSKSSCADMGIKYVPKGTRFPNATVV